ncbi:MAG: DegT/DnrJ/EryC1/StrS family aminotransferase [Chitinophagaceae bacterium]
MRKLNIKYQMTDTKWEGEFAFTGTRVYDSARRFEKNMYKQGKFQCLSFGSTKPLEIGRVGAILTDDYQAYKKLSLMRSDGRDLRDQSWQKSQQVTGVNNQKPQGWGAQKHFNVGYHYCPTVSDCKKGLELLQTYQPKKQTVSYPDCREATII